MQMVTAVNHVVVRGRLQPARQQKTSQRKLKKLKKLKKRKTVPRTLLQQPKAGKVALQQPDYSFH